MNWNLFKRWDTRKRPNSSIHCFTVDDADNSDVCVEYLCESM